MRAPLHFVRRARNIFLLGILLTSQLTYAQRPRYDLSHLQNEGDSVTFDPEQFEFLENFNRMNHFLETSLLPYATFHEILIENYLGFQSTYKNGKIISKFVFPKDTISPNQLGQDDLDREVESFYKEYGDYSAEAETFHESVTQLFQKLKDALRQEKKRPRPATPSSESSHEESDEEAVASKKVKTK